ncbi:unnamed protein product [Linum tenue]|nr:unnamed protein product [Linum tenue]
MWLSGRSLRGGSSPTSSGRPSGCVRCPPMMVVVLASIRIGKIWAKGGGSTRRTFFGLRRRTVFILELFKRIEINTGQSGKCSRFFFLELFSSYLCLNKVGAI